MKSTFIIVRFLLSAAICCLVVLAKENDRKKVLILGAGLSGITAANTLLNAGIDDFLILEGQNYIGGRIHQAPFGGYKIEEGANWIHYALEEETKPIRDLAQKERMKGVYSNYSDVIIRNEKGEDVTDLKAMHHFEEIEKHVRAAVKLREENKQGDIPARVGLQLMGWKSKNPVEKVIEYFGMDFEYSKRPELVSFRQMIVRPVDYFITDQRGMINLYKGTFEKFRSKIHLGKTIKEIKYSDKEVTVTTTAGEVFTGDYALCTFSAGVLASDMVKWQPALPVWKKEVIFKMPMSVYTKIFLKFPCRKFWDNQEFILIAGHERGFFPVIQDLERPGMFPKGSGMMLVTVTEDEGRRIEKQAKWKTKREIFRLLKGMYGWKACMPSAIHYKRWSLNPYTRGAYSEAVVGTTSEDFEKLAKNLDNLYFSGEATTEDWYGYMQGAYITGEEKGKMLVEKVKGCAKSA